MRWYKRLVASEDADLAERRAEIGRRAEGAVAEGGMAEALPDDPAELKRLVAEARGEAFALRPLVRVIEEDTGIAVLKKPVAGRPTK